MAHLQQHQRIKCWAMELTKEVQNLPSENDETWLKVIKEDPNKWQDISGSEDKRQYGFQLAIQM